MSWLSILPPIVAIVIAIWKREVVLALLVAIFTAQMVLSQGNPFYAFEGTVNRIIDVFSDSYNTKILIFSLMIGALIHLIRISGGVEALVNWLTQKSIIDNQRKAGILPATIGSGIFIDTNMSILSAGLPSQSIFDRFQMSRARLAYIIDSTCAPISVLILINGWGASILGHLHKTPITNPTEVMFSSIAYNFYAILTLLVVYYTVISTRVFGALKTYELNNKASSAVLNSERQATKKRYMLIPMIFMVVSIFVFMFITGDGDLRKGRGADSVLWSILLTTGLTFLMLRFTEKHSTEKLMKESFKGLGQLLPLVTLVMLAFALSSAMGDLKTGLFVASAISDTLPNWSIPALVFILAGFIAFTTGTSFGTFGILIPITMPLALQLGIDPSLLLAAVLGGSVFGDHASPISDTTVIASLASGCELLDHVKTQLPYALFTGGLSIILYIIFGLI